MMGLGDSTTSMELGIQKVRRSLRKTAPIPVWLRNEKLGPIWEEESETQNVSRFGARLRCRHLVQAGYMLVIVRRDDGRRANARVTYCLRGPGGERQLGIEFIDNDDFWGLDWNSSESEPPLLTPMGIPVKVKIECLPTPAADCNPAQPGDTTAVPVSIQEEFEIVVAAPVFALDDNAADTGALLVPVEAKSVKLAPSAATDDSAADISAPPVQAQAEGGEIAANLVIDASTADTDGPSIQKPVKVVVIAPGLVTDDAAADASAPPGEVETEGVEIAPSLVAEDSAAGTSARADQAVTEVVQVAPPTVTDRGAGDTSAPPVQAEARGIEIAPSPSPDESTTSRGAPPVREAAEQEVPQSSRVAVRDEGPVAPSFLDFYGLREQPFAITPDPAFLYLSQTHRDALTSLAQGIQNLRGFMALIAQPGLGKTTLLNKLMEELRDSARIVFLFQTQCDSRELLRYLLAELGIEETGKDAVAMHKALKDILFREMLEGRRFVLFVDEAQNLHDSVLETIRLLSDFETTHTKLIQIVLSGQPQLADTLRRPQLSQLRQRIAILTNLKPLSPTETGQYIDHRLRTAGSNGKPILTPDALTLIAERSMGIPRIINNLCFNTLFLGYSEGGNPVGSEVARKAVATSDWELLVR